MYRTACSRQHQAALALSVRSGRGAVRLTGGCGARRARRDRRDRGDARQHQPARMLRVRGSRGHDARGAARAARQTRHSLPRLRRGLPARAHHAVRRRRRRACAPRVFVKSSWAEGKCSELVVRASWCVRHRHCLTCVCRLRVVLPGTDICVGGCSANQAASVSHLPILISCITAQPSSSRGRNTAALLVPECRQRRSTRAPRSSQPRSDRPQSPGRRERGREGRAGPNGLTQRRAPRGRQLVDRPVTFGSKESRPEARAGPGGLTRRGRDPQAT